MTEAVVLVTPATTPPTRGKTLVRLARRVNIRAKVQKHASLARGVNLRQMKQQHVRLVLKVLTMTTTIQRRSAFIAMQEAMRKVETQVASLVWLVNTTTTPTPEHLARRAVPET